MKVNGRLGMISAFLEDPRSRGSHSAGSWEATTLAPKRSSELNESLHLWTDTRYLMGSEYGRTGARPPERNPVWSEGGFPHPPHSSWSIPARTRLWLSFCRMYPLRLNGGASRSTIFESAWTVHAVFRPLLMFRASHLQESGFRSSPAMPHLPAPWRWHRREPSPSTAPPRVIERSLATAHSWTRDSPSQTPVRNCSRRSSGTMSPSCRKIILA